MSEDPEKGGYKIQCEVAVPLPSKVDTQYFSVHLISSSQNIFLKSPEIQIPAPSESFSGFVDCNPSGVIDIHSTVETIKGPSIRRLLIHPDLTDSAMFPSTGQRNTYPQSNFPLRGQTTSQNGQFAMPLLPIDERAPVIVPSAPLMNTRATSPSLSVPQTMDSPHGHHRFDSLPSPQVPSLQQQPLNFQRSFFPTFRFITLAFENLPSCEECSFPQMIQTAFDSGHWVIRNLSEQGSVVIDFNKERAIYIQLMYSESQATKFGGFADLAQILSQGHHQATISLIDHFNTSNRCPCSPIVHLEFSSSRQHLPNSFPRPNFNLPMTRVHSTETWFKDSRTTPPLDDFSHLVSQPAPRLDKKAPSRDSSPSTVSPSFRLPKGRKFTKESGSKETITPVMTSPPTTRTPSPCDPLGPNNEFSQNEFSDKKLAEKLASPPLQETLIEKKAPICDKKDEFKPSLSQDTHAEPKRELDLKTLSERQASNISSLSIHVDGESDEDNSSAGGVQILPLARSLRSMLRSPEFSNNIATQVTLLLSPGFMNTDVRRVVLSKPRGPQVESVFNSKFAENVKVDFLAPCSILLEPKSDPKARLILSLYMGTDVDVALSVELDLQKILMSGKSTDWRWVYPAGGNGLRVTRKEPKNKRKAMCIEVRFVEKQISQMKVHTTMSSKQITL
eukprot:GHVP01070651.1.p1 GENE.GHVP01070651.1~~GHVP01070651.1.p1  ORF type:complete len:733 (+),score=108.92 GHVP01070651.1:179-2200(+)